MITVETLIYTLIKCLLCTIIVECGLAFIIKLRGKKNYINIVLVNILTNPLLNIILLYINIFIGYKMRRFCIYPLEILVLLTEGFIYKKVTDFKRPYLISLILNLVSYLLGILINMVI